MKQTAWLKDTATDRAVYPGAPLLIDEALFYVNPRTTRPTMDLGELCESQFNIIRIIYCNERVLATPVFFKFTLSLHFNIIENNFYYRGSLNKIQVVIHTYSFCFPTQLLVYFYHK